MNIFIVTVGYPSKKSPQMGTFVYKIAQEFAQLGNKVTVITHRQYSFFRKSHKTYGSELATVLRPRSLTFSAIQIGKWNTFTLTQYARSKVIKRAIVNYAVEPDIIYCHFIVSALLYLQAFPNPTKPVFVAVGEYTWIDSLRAEYDLDFYNQSLAKVTGFIAVSSMVKDKLISIGIPAEKIIVEPNGTDLSIFKPADKKALRLKYAIPLDKKIVLYVGNFLETKGAFKAAEALDYVSDDVRAIFLGRGSQTPSHSKIIYTGAVPNALVADYMALADVFVLPSLNEGSSNVIVEAMASGLPIVSSDLPEIRVQCTDDFSILVNPKSTEEIAEALNTILNDNKLRNHMSLNAREHAKKFDIKERAKRIMEYVKENFH